MLLPVSHVVESFSTADVVVSLLIIAIFSGADAPPAICGEADVVLVVLTVETAGAVVDTVVLAVFGVIDIDVDDPKINIGRLYSSCAMVRGPPVV